MILKSSRPISAALLWKLAWRSPARAVAIAWWAATGKRVRARNRLRDAMMLVLDTYSYWVSWIEPETASHDALRGLVDNMPARPTVAVLALAGVEDAQWLLRVLAMLHDQPWPDWELVVPRDLADAIAGLIEVDTARVRIAPNAEDRTELLEHLLVSTIGDIVFPIDPDIIPARGALVRIAAQGAERALVFGDEDRLDYNGDRRDPWFKPEWNEELAFAQDFLTGACAFGRSQALAELPLPGAPRSHAIYELAMRIAGANASAIAHSPHVLAHRLAPRDDTGRLASVALLIEPRGGQAVPAGDSRIAVDWPLPDLLPLITLIVPTRDKVDLLQACIASVLELTEYSAYEILVMDNGSTEPETLAYFATLSQQPRVTIVRDVEPFNYAAINNRAAGLARGDYICLLNNDTLVLSPNWLTAMLRHAVRPQVGAVGAKLLYADHTIQHAGVAIGLGNAAGHSHRFQPDDDTGYHDLAHCTHYVSAVTGACLLVAKDKYLGVGGLDAEHLQIAYNDVDLCLKLLQAGLHNVYEPRARLLHLESKSRGSDFSPQNNARYMRELAVLQSRWDTTIAVDPVHHRLLDRSSEAFRIIIPA